MREHARAGWLPAATVAGAGGAAVLLSVTDRGASPLRAVASVVLVGLIALGARAGMASRTSTDQSPVEAFWDQVVAELERARRHDRPMAVVRVPLTGFATAASAQQMEREARAALRVVDVASVQDADLLLLMPEGTATQAAVAVERLLPLLGSRVAADGVRVAAFPGDALTLGGLCECLDGRRQVGRLRHASTSAVQNRVETAS